MRRCCIDTSFVGIYHSESGLRGDAHFVEVVLVVVVDVVVVEIVVVVVVVGG